MPINTKESYIEIGYNINANNELSNSIKIPAPHTLTSAPQFLSDAGRNADGTMILQQISRPMITLHMGWATMPSEMHWKINRWFEKYGIVCWIKFFDQNTGTVKIQRFYRGQTAEVTPSSEQKIVDGYLIPKYYIDYALSFIDMGEKDVKVIKTLGV